MKLAKTYPIRLLCRLLDAPRSSVYYEPNQASDHNVYKVALLDLAAEYPTYGYRRLTVMLKRAGHPANAKRVRRGPIDRVELERIEREIDSPSFFTREFGQVSFLRPRGTLMK